ncbi:hypothetical protein [Holospora obtusa]|uniref:hypothetical protein n=1 Tax=Holospora obtusa TaxID=49893 RepID=UPI0012EB90D3|nr:hypothetical protein [Holospora obtusa]
MLIGLQKRLYRATFIDDFGYTMFFRNLIELYPFKITKILTDNGAQFTYALLAEHFRPKNKTHPFDVICKACKIEHRLTHFRHPLTQ